MIRRSSEKRIEDKEALFGGEGTITINHLINSPQDLYDKGRAFTHNIVRPGCSIGYHVHNNESETYYILRGEGLMNHNGEMITVLPGDVTLTGAGEGHGIAAVGDEPLEFIGLILYR